MRLPTRIFSKFSTVSIVVIYGNKVNDTNISPLKLITGLHCKTISYTAMWTGISFSLCASPQIGVQYPINRLRNIAIK